jgi:hypothetical protein
MLVNNQVNRQKGSRKVINNLVHPLLLEIVPQLYKKEVNRGLGFAMQYMSSSLWLNMEQVPALAQEPKCTHEMSDTGTCKSGKIKVL